MPITAQLAEDSKREMYDFVQEVIRLLDETIENPTGEDGLLIHEEMVQPLRAAWTGYRADYRSAVLEERIFGAEPDVLEDHGLYGAQSAAKLALFRMRKRLFGQQRIGKALIWLLDAIDTYLDSIIAATGASPALKEIKDMLRNSIDD